MLFFVADVWTWTLGLVMLQGLVRGVRQTLGLLLGWARPPGEQPVALSEAPVASQAHAPQDLGFDSLLPGLRGRVAVPAGPGRALMVSLRAVTVSDVFGAFQYLTEARAQWPFGSEPESFVAYVALEGPGWELTVFFGEAPGRVEYYAARAGGEAAVSGQVRWEILAQALVLSPDFDAMVDYLALSPYRAGHLVVQ